MSIYTLNNKKEEKFLRTKTKPYSFSNHTPKDTDELIRTMRASMRKAQGIGLSANQIGLPWRVFVAEVPSRDGSIKFYAVFNPKIEVTGKDEIYYEEGCLSVPGVFGKVKRPERIVLFGEDKKGKPVKIKCWGLLARVFQHEVDHLEGKLFIDHKPKELHILD